MYYTESIPQYRSVEEINTAMAGVYKNMFFAVAVSMLVSWFIGNDETLLKFFFTGYIKWIVIFAPLAAIFAITAVLNSNPSKQLALVMLFGFAALMGLSFATIFAVYQLGSIFTAFMGAGVLFGTMSLYGYFTKKNLDSIGKFLFIGLIAVVIASIINIFLGSTLMATVISAVAILVFLGLTAYDTQRIREMVMYEGDTSVAEVSGALTLYINFINIFLSLLQLFGDKKE